MKITEKQLIILIDTLRDSLVFFERKSGDPFTYTHKFRESIYQDILNQQSDEIRVIE